MHCFFKLEVALLVSLGLYGCGPGGGEAGEARVLKVETEAVVWHDMYARTVRYYGLVEARQSSELAFELAGTVDAVHVEEGERVPIGTLLASLDKARLRARLKSRQAAVSEAEANLELAWASYRRQVRLVAAEAASQQALDEAKQQRDVAEASIKRLQAEVAATKVDLEKSTLLAPYDGTVVRQHVDVGTTLNGAQAVLSFIESGQLEARIGLPPAQANGLEPGKRYALRVADRAGPLVEGRLLRVIPRRDSRVRTVDARFALDQAETVLQPGDPVVLSLPVRLQQRGFRVPRRALTESVRGLWALYFVVANEAGQSVLELRPAEIIGFETDRAYVTAPAASAERFVVSGLQRLTPGQRVELQTESVP